MKDIENLKFYISVEKQKASRVRSACRDVNIITGYHNAVGRYEAFCDFELVLELLLKNNESNHGNDATIS